LEGENLKFDQAGELTLDGYSNLKEITNIKISVRQ